MLTDRPAMFHDLDAPDGGEIVAVANAATTHADDDPSHGALVIVARTADNEHRALGGGSNGPLRAAVSVAVAAGNTRLSDGIGGTETVERSVASLPEIIRTAAEGRCVGAVHVGCIQDSSLAALAVWFEVDGHVASAAARQQTMDLLAAAADRQRAYLDARAAELAAQTPTTVTSDSGVRDFDTDDPRIDATTGLATHAEFELAVESYESDEATLVVVDLDDFADVAERCGSDTTDVILREIADRMVSTCRKDDLIARLRPETFAVLFHDAPRSVGMQIAKRLLDTIAQPLTTPGAPVSVTATVALAHQFGLVDMEELVESADGAVASGKRLGRGRLVIAS